MKLIDVSKVIKEIERFKGYLDDDMILRIKIAINRLPTVEAEPIRHGKWIHNGFMEVKCNNCGNVFHELEDTNYCPNCGAKMIPTIPKEIIDAVLGEDEVNDETN